MNDESKWKYVVTPAFVARFAPGELEVLDLNSDEWGVVQDQAIHETVSKDGSVVPKDVAEKAHQAYKRQLL